MVVPIPKIVYNKKTGKNDQVMALLYNCCFYYRKEAQKYSVLYSVKIDQVTAFYNCRFYNWKKDILEESLEIM